MLSIILIFFLGSIVYSNAFFSSFHFDDYYFIVHNPAIKNIYDLPNIWHFFHGRFVTFLSFAFNYHMNGLNVLGYHLFNVAVHLISAMLVWWLTVLTFSTPAMKADKIAQHANLVALCAGLIFVSHPVQVEAVTNIWQRAASMMAMFYLASLCCYVKSRLLRTGPPLPVRGYYILSLITAVAAMFTKENAVTLPLMILFYEYAFFNTKETINWKYLSPFLLTIFIIPVTFLFIGSQTFQDMHGNLNAGGEVMTPMHYFLTQFRVMITYIRLAFLPLNQNMDYDYPVFKNFFELPVLFSFIFLMSILFGTKSLFSKYRLVSFSICWFFLTLAIPESSFWAMGDVILEHRLYLPLVGYSIFLASSMFYLLGKDSIKPMVVVLSVIIAFNSVLTYQRNKVWENEFDLWNDTVLKSPHKARPYLLRGVSFLKEGDLFEAILDLNKGLEIDPKSAMGHNDRGLCYFKQGKYIQAIADYTKAIEIKPDSAEAYFNRGLCYDSQGNAVKAITDYSKTIEIDNNYADAYQNRGAIYGEQDKLAQAIADFTKAIEISPANASVFLNRGMLYYKLKEYDKAWSDVRKAQGSGYPVDSRFIDALKKASGPG